MSLATLTDKLGEKLDWENMVDVQQIAAYARDIYDHCRKPAMGSQDSKDGWQAVVKWERC